MRLIVPRQLPLTARDFTGRTDHVVSLDALIPIPRLGEPTDVTRLLLFLTSSDPPFITGSEYVIDGGLLLGPALQVKTT
ncbi:SDR family oxidoreductase [Actinosynnema sp. ALI-1.44]|uniref:SDR family oxidoreductase n=1 Tax=Actinosynnema sp. ALI-1.44 TaxID=1933779 RepID=UPI001EDB4F8A|nr:SDR family oxidoreductase [Actinosynnema sp. ALI-1.44]